MDIVRRASELAADGRDRSPKIGANPPVRSGERRVAVDALIVRRAAAP